MNKFELGTVFRWNNFPEARYGEKNKARWFVIVGFSSHFAPVAEIYLCTTTTQLDSFKNGNRRDHDHFIFKVNEFGFFDEDCAIDFFETPYAINQDRVNRFKDDMEFKGKLDNKTLIHIYNSFLDSKNISPVMLKDIHESYNMAGITGLRKFKPSKK